MDPGTGLGFTLGAGYDIPITRRVAITPAFNYWYGKPGDLKVMGESALSGFSHNVVDFTIGVTIQ